MPSQARSYKIPLCICGLEHQNVGVNKNKYHNIALFFTIGLVGFIVGVTLLPYRIRSGEVISAWTWMEVTVTGLVIVYLLARVFNYLNKGHTFFCSVRRTIIELVK